MNAVVQHPLSASREAAPAPGPAAPRQLPLGTLPQPWHTIGRHAALANLTHDEQARLDAAAHLNHFLAQQVVPALRRRFDAAEAAAPPASREDAWALLEQDPRFAIWSRLRRGSMESRQRGAFEAAFRQREALGDACRSLTVAAGTLELDPDLAPPAYLADTHAHLMPGGYVASFGEDDVTAGAAYEISVYSVVPGRSGPYSDGAGRALARWVESRFPGFQPRRILDLGCGAGLNTCAVARAFPDAEVIGVDAGAGMLRYAAARAASLGITNVRWVQADIERLPARLGPADLAYTAIVLHETSHEALKNVFRRCREVIAPGGLTLHVEQPAYHDRPWFEQCMRDWDGRYNNERFWSRLYELDLRQELADAGFAPARIFEDAMSAVPWHTDARAPGRMEDYGRTGNWQVVGAWREPA